MKDQTRTTFLYFLMICIILLTSCGKESSDFTKEFCIPPVEKLAYPVGVPPSPYEKLSEVGPLGNWQFQASLPEPSERGLPPQFVVGSNEVWVLPLYGTKVFHYNVTTDDWKVYNSIDLYSAVPENLYKSRDGTLWGLGTITEDLDSQSDPSLLSRYNKEADRFEFVKDLDGLLNNFFFISFPAHISEDKTGLLWFFGSSFNDDDVGLFSYDASTRKAEKHLSLPRGNIYAGPSVSKDGLIWFYNGGSERVLQIYSPKTHQVQTYNGLPNFDQIGHIGRLYFDRDGRLWLDNKGWLDFTNDPINPVWYEIIPNPVFLTDRGEGLSKYGWVPPLYIYQSSNLWFWFTTDNGTIRLDPKAEEWCLFTTGYSPVVEDDEGNIWILVFDKLYKYKLEIE